ncbi:MAG TPA: MFS transporter [Polyangiaceae bacterium]|nr:MFS transporter [Polyangiaceae bacterium]
MAYGYAYSALLLVPKFATVVLYANPTQVGQLASCPVLAAVLAAPFCGRLLDRGGYRTAMLFGTCVFAVSAFGFGSLHELGPLAYALRALHGVGNAFIAGGSATLVTRLVPSQHHGRAFGTAGAASLMMNAVASSATERLADAFGWAVAFEVAGAALFVALGLALCQPYEAENADTPATLSVRSAAASRRAGGYATFAAGAGFGMLITFTQPYALSLGAVHVATMFVGYTLTALFVRLGMGGAVDRFGRRRAALLALGVYAATVLSAAALRPEFLFPLGLCFGLAHGVAWPALSALAVESAPPGRIGSALSRMQAQFAAGTVLAVWLGGRIVDARGYPLAFALVALAVATGAVALGLPQARRLPAA